MINVDKRFLVALSFPGEHREFVGSVANLLAERLGRERVLYDKFNEAEFARIDLDIYLQRLYYEQSRLVVVFLCSDYELKAWPRLEWRAIRGLMNTDDAAIMFIGFDNANISGLFPATYGSIDVAGREPSIISELIVQRLSMSPEVNRDDDVEPLDLRSIRPFAGQIERSTLFKPFKDFVRCRDIVFAVGGIGSGLATFLHQFRGELEQSHDHCFPSADFNPEIYHKIQESRTRKRAIAIEYNRNTDYDQFDLKCLLATLAYMTYHDLRQNFAPKIDRVIPDIYAEDPVGFADHYFANSGAMFKGTLKPIVEHFFSTVQKLAEATGPDDCIIVFMPWAKLAAFFARHSDKDQKNLAKDLWDALGAFAAASPETPRGSTTDSSATTMPSDKYPKVCLVVAGSEIPYGTSTFQTALVAKSLWPIPPLDVGEVSKLLGMISEELQDEELAGTLIEWSGGSPWYVKLILSCAQHLLLEGNAKSAPLGGQTLVEAACNIAEKILIGGPATVTGDLERFLRGHLDAVREVLGDGQATDTVIEEAWAGPQRRRERGLQIASPRIEAFVASGLTWLYGSPWDPASPQYVFRRYPTLILQRAGRLPLVVYRSVTGRSLELAGY